MVKWLFLIQMDNVDPLYETVASNSLEAAINLLCRKYGIVQSEISWIGVE